MLATYDYVLLRSAGDSNEAVNEVSVNAHARVVYVPGMKCVSPSGDTSGAKDYTAIQNALNSLTAGGTLFLSPGTYYVNSTLTTLDDTCVAGGGTATIVQVTEATATIKIPTVDNVRILDLNLTGKGTESLTTSTSSNGVAGIWVYASSNVEIRGCYLSNHAGGGILLEGSSETVRIVNNTIVGMGSTVIDAGDNTADGAIKWAASSHAQSGIIIEGNDLSGHCFGMLPTGILDLVIANNYIHDIPGQHGIYVTTGGDLTITGNVIQDIEQVGMKVQLSLSEDVEPVLNISGNTISTCGQIGIGVNATTAYYSKNALVASNNIFDVEYGMYLRGIKNGHVCGNRIRKCSKNGMFVYNFEGSIVNNRIEECEYAGLSFYAPDSRAIVDNLVIVDCPLNVAAATGTHQQNAILLTDQASPNNGTLFLGDIYVSYEHQSPPANLTYCIYATAETTVVWTGKLTNRLTVGNNWLGAISGYHMTDMQPAPTDIADGNTAITAANLQTRLLTMTATTARAPTVPTGTAMNGILPIGGSLDWSFINLATDSSAITVTQATDHTLVGYMVIGQNTTGVFRTRCSAANTAITYRIG